MRVLITGIVVSMLAASVLLAGAEIVSAQPIMMKKAMENGLKTLDPIKGLAKSVHIAVIDKQIHVGSNWIAFNPNTGNAKVVTVIGKQ